MNRPRRERPPGDRKLYTHQEAALHRLCGDSKANEPDRHLVVASGTGSGKTECFLLPAIDWILRHPTRVGQGKGIRALLVYPMNALVNDQVRRLRNLVGCWGKQGDAPIPLTFARYTSETEATRRAGQGREPGAPDNQLLGRDEIVENPPDILITNFAMLEQALLRPQETPFFTTVDAFAWRFLILDEAHSYRGAQAIELARLMQRVRAAVRRGKRLMGVEVREPICVATSATLAVGSMSVAERQKATAEFAGQLFGLTFPPETVLFADREDPTRGEAAWGFANPATAAAADRAWSSLPASALTNLGRPVDDSFVKQLAPIAPAERVQAARASAADRNAFLHHLLRGHPLFHWLWDRIRDKPARFEDLLNEAAWAGSEDKDRADALERLVTALNAARRSPGEQPLLPCRYHLFASASKGFSPTWPRMRRWQRNQSHPGGKSRTWASAGWPCAGSSRRIAARWNWPAAVGAASPCSCGPRRAGNRASTNRPFGTAPSSSTRSGPRSRRAKPSWPRKSTWPSCFLFRERANRRRNTGRFTRFPPPETTWR